MLFLIRNMEIYRLVQELGKRTIPSFSPREIDPIPHIPLGKCEMETVAQDLLQISVEARQWVGVSVKDFALQHQSRLRDLVRKNILLKFVGHMTRFPKTTNETFGRIITIKSNIIDMHFASSSETSTFKGFPISVLNGIKLLEKKGYVEIVPKLREDVLVPTEKLINYVVNIRSGKQMGG